MGDQVKTSHPTTDQINSAVGVLRSILSDAPTAAPESDSHTAASAVLVPQVIVVYRDSRRAYGRTFLKSLGSRVSLFC